MSKQPDLRKAMKMALYALENSSPLIEDFGGIEHMNIHHKAIMALYKTLAQPDQIIDGDTSDGYHTFNELYDFRKAYNALLFNEWAANGKYSVHKSKRHFDGEYCFGGAWFIVVAQLPDGQISNHYEMKDWDKFRVPETYKVLFEYDNHTGKDVLQRLFSLCSLAQPEHPLDKKADNARELGLDYGTHKTMKTGDIINCAASGGIKPITPGGGGPGSGSGGRTYYVGIYEGEIGCENTDQKREWVGADTFRKT